MTTTVLERKTSLKVPYQLPEFVREENYQTFVTFLQAYFEWMEQQDIGDGKQGALYGSQNLLNYKDIDKTLDEFVQYFVNDFLPHFPAEALADKRQLIKYAKQYYASKGTESAYHFLFRALYNSDCEVFLTKELILKASDGKWYYTKSLKLFTVDDDFLNIDNYRLFGEDSKSLATIERSIRSGNKTEVYINDIERTFLSGEFVRVVDNRNQTLYFKDGEVVPADTVGAKILRAKIVGSISSLNIDSRRRGQYYNGRSDTYLGDPVIFIGGLSTSNGIGATAYVDEVTTGSLREISVINGSYGYRPDPNTQIFIRGGGGKGAIAKVTSVDPSGQINVAFIPQDYIAPSAYTTIGNTYYSFMRTNPSANANTSLSNTFTFDAFPTYPISSVTLFNGGGGYSSLPLVSAICWYHTTDLEPTQELKIKASLSNMGMLGPVVIENGGSGYGNGEFLVFTGGTGYGANANVTCDLTGKIIRVNYRYLYANGFPLFTLRGMGYRNTSLPILTVDSVNGNGAILRVDTVLGDGAEFGVTADERGIGAITKFRIENYGEDYISTPRVSLKVRDIAVSNVSLANPPVKGDFIYQGSNQNSAIFRANVDSFFLLSPDIVPENSVYIIRVYDYNIATSSNTQLKIDARTAGPSINLNIISSYNTYDDAGNYVFRNGIRTYGNGAAQATAKFLNGLIIGQGQYLDDSGWPSSYHVLQSDVYNEFSYVLMAERAYSSYEKVINSVLHPSGTNLIPVNMIKSHADSTITDNCSAANTTVLQYATGDLTSFATFYSNFSNPTNNIIKFENLSGFDVYTYFFGSNDSHTISVISTHGPNIYSEVIGASNVGNTITLRENTFSHFSNVMVGNTNTSSNLIYVSSVTNQYDLINNGDYSSENKMRDLVFAGDSILVSNGISLHYATVNGVDYNNQFIDITPKPTFNTNTAYISIGRNVSTLQVVFYRGLSPH